LPLFAGLTGAEVDRVVEGVRAFRPEHARSGYEAAV
jgi:hypothetical protein